MQITLHSVNDLQKELRHFSIKKTLLVCRPSFELQNFKKDIFDLPTEFIKFSDFTPNPKIEEIEKAIKIFIEKGCDSILAVGGGSSIDVAKAVKYFISIDSSMIDCFNEKKLPKLDIPLVAIPTTAGSGSEATPFAVLYKDGKKVSIQHLSLIPEIAVLLPDPLLILPKYVKCTSFMDAFSQAIESYWSPFSTNESRSYAKFAIENLVDMLDSYIFSAPDLESASTVMQASYFAGRAIAITRTTAPHAMSYKLTSEFGIAHGHAVALSLIQVWKYMNVHINETTDERGPEYFKNTLCEISSFIGQNTLEDGVLFYADIVKKMGLDSPITNDPSKVDFLASSVDVSRLKNNPVPLKYENLRDFYSKILVFNL